MTTPENKLRHDQLDNETKNSIYKFVYIALTTSGLSALLPVAYNLYAEVTSKDSLPYLEKDQTGYGVIFIFILMIIGYAVQRAETLEKDAKRMDQLMAEADERDEQFRNQYPAYRQLNSDTNDEAKSN
jgi:hypothetical protein